MKKLLSCLLVLTLALALASAAAVTAGADRILLAGDCNVDGEVDMKDVLTCRKFIAGLSVSMMSKAAADVNGDGSVDMKDVLLLRKFIAGLIPSFDVVSAGGRIAVCLASEPETLDPALVASTDGVTLVSHLFSGLAKWAPDENGNPAIVADAATELVPGTPNDNGTVTYTYTLRDGLTWSDGQPVTAGDFEFAWNRAASEELRADYGYLFEVVDGYGTDTLGVKALDDKTLEVTLISAASYWNELLAFPTFFPVRADVVAAGDWANDPETYVCNGAYTMTAWEHDRVITIEKNKDYADADQITMDAIDFYLSDDPDEALTRFENGDWQMIDMVGADANLQTAYPDEYVVAGELGTYYVTWNADEDILPAGSGLAGADAEKARAEIRGAINALFDRNYIVSEITQAGQVPASSLVAMGMTNPDGTQFYETAGHNDGFIGYYNVAKDAVESNKNAAIETLKKYYDFSAVTGKFTNVPTLTYLFNSSPGHQAIGEYMQTALSGIGITLELQDMEWPEYLNARQNGGFSICRCGWIADYNDPITFLDMWVTGAGNNDAGLGSSDHATAAAYSLDLTDFGYDLKVENGTWAETYDVLIATIKGCSDEVVRYQLMHRAEDLLMSTGCICPLYYYTDVYMISRNVQDFLATPTGVKLFMYCSVSAPVS